MKRFSLTFIQIAWVTETIAVLIFTIVSAVCLPMERIKLWLKFLPLISALIAAQGSAAGIGPLVSDKIKAAAEKTALREGIKK